MVSLKPMFHSFILNGTLLFAWQIVSIAIYCDIVMPSIVIFIITHPYPTYQQNSHTPTHFIITLHTDNEYNSFRLPGQKQITLALKLIIFLCSFHNSRRLHYALKRNVIILGTVKQKQTLSVTDHGDGIMVCRMSFQSRIAAVGYLLMPPPLCDMEVPSPHSHPLSQPPSPEAYNLLTSTLLLSFILSCVLVLLFLFIFAYTPSFPG